MERDFITMLIRAKGLINKIVAVVAFIGLVIAFFLSGWGGWTLVIIALGVFLIINSLVIVMPGNVGYQIILGHLVDHPIYSGLHMIWPFISSITEVNSKLQGHKDVNEMKMSDNRDIKLTYVLNYQIDSQYVHLLHQYIGETDYVKNMLCPWLDTVMTQEVATKTYDNINTGLKDLSDTVDANFRTLVQSKCYALCGKQLFRNMSVSIIDVKFDDEYEKSVSALTVAQKEIEIQEQKNIKLLAEKKAEADAKRILAEAEAYATTKKGEAEATALKKKAEAEANAMKMKGASENEVREKLGEILNAHPELLKEALAKNFPKVVGSGTIVNLDSL
jgi:regulator of protease activity HflC (stomatin/prohibitin superfamily)